MFKKLFQVLLFSTTLGVELVAIAPPTPASPLFDTASFPAAQLISQIFRPPNRGAPPRTVGGASRGGCLRASSQLTALTPVESLGLTTASHPTFFWYIPRTNSPTAEILIQDDHDTDIYHATIPLPGTSGIVSFTLPETAPPLEAGKTYQWYISLVCVANDRLQDVFTSAGVQRVEAEVALTEQLQQAGENDRPQIFAEAGIWHEAIASLAEQLRSNPTDPQLLSQWQALLTSVGLVQVIDQPLVEVTPE